MKRFTETAKWADPWFRGLPIEAKCLWLWILDNCDCAGIMEIDMGLAEFQIGSTKPLASPLEALGDRVEMHGSKLFVPKFIRYQYGNELHFANTAHRGVIRRLELAKIPCPVRISEKKDQAPSKPLQSPLQGAQDMDKDMDTDKDLSTKASTKKKKEKPSIDEVRAFCKELGLPESDGDATFWKWEGNGWINGNKPIKDWKATIRSWKSAGHLPIQKSNNRFTQQNQPSTHQTRSGYRECQEETPMIPEL
jgi:hypothetical protein